MDDIQDLHVLFRAAVRGPVGAAAFVDRLVECWPTLLTQWKEEENTLLICMDVTMRRLRLRVFVDTDPVTGDAQTVVSISVWRGGPLAWIWPDIVLWLPEPPQWESDHYQKVVDAFKVMI